MDQVAWGVAAVAGIAAAGAVARFSPNDDPEPPRLDFAAAGAAAGTVAAALTGVAAFGPLFAVGAPAAWIDARHQRLPWWLTTILYPAVVPVLALDVVRSPSPIAATAVAALIAAVIWALYLTGMMGRGDAMWAPALAAATGLAYPAALAVPFYFVFSTGVTLAAVTLTRRAGRGVWHAYGPGLIAGTVAAGPVATGFVRLAS